MGVYSTVDLTRQDAICRILAALDDASDSEVAHALFALVGERTLNNYGIVPEVPAAVVIPEASHANAV